VTVIDQVDSVLGLVEVLEEQGTQVKDNVLTVLGEPVSQSPDAQIIGAVQRSRSNVGPSRQ
jgi:hypothetical protein